MSIFPLVVETTHVPSYQCPNIACSLEINDHVNYLVQQVSRETFFDDLSVFLNCDKTGVSHVFWCHRLLCSSCLMTCESCSSNSFDNEINSADRTIWQLHLYYNGVFSLGRGWVRLIFLSACKLFPAVLLPYFHVERKFGEEFTRNTENIQKVTPVTQKNRIKRKTFTNSDIADESRQP